MKKADILAALDGIDSSVLIGTPKQREIARLFMEGISVKEIAKRFNLSDGRIRQVLSKQARGALLYKKQKSDIEYQPLVAKYTKIMGSNEKVTIRSEWHSLSKHVDAATTARKIQNKGNDKLKSYVIRVELKGSNPLIWRRIIMPAGATYKRLHDVIQNVTNFQSGYPYDAHHLFKFDLVEEKLIVTNDEGVFLKRQHDTRPMADENNKNMPSYRKPSGLKIDDYLQKYKDIRYIYDFGDDWNFGVKLEQIVDDYYFGFPTLLDGAETAPPENVGGIRGFYEFLEAYRNPKHPEHEAMKEWAESIYFREYDAEWINQALKGINYQETDWDKINHDNYRIIEDKYRKK